MIRPVLTGKLGPNSTLGGGSDTPRGHLRDSSSPVNALGGSTNRAVTPSSSRGSTAYSDLEEVVSDVMGIRLSSLHDLRKKIDELSRLQAEEEKSFKEAMQLVLEQSITAKEYQKEAEEDYEVRLRKEKGERQKALEIMAQFKREGTSVMSQMKETLKEVQQKYKAELEKNAKLTAQLRRMEQQNRHVGTGNGSLLSGGEGSDDTLKLRTQVETLSQLLEEEDQVIVELQQRNRALEGKVKVLTEQREKLLEVEAQGSLYAENGDDDEEYKHLLHTIRTQDRQPLPSQVRKCHELIENFKRLTLILMQRLKSEQRQRLKVEEQATKMAAQQDDLLNRMEVKVKGLSSRSSVAPSTTSVAGGSEMGSVGRGGTPPSVSLAGAPSVVTGRLAPERTSGGPRPFEHDNDSSGRQYSTGVLAAPSASHAGTSSDPTKPRSVPALSGSSSRSTSQTSNVAAMGAGTGAARAGPGQGIGLGLGPVRQPLPASPPNEPRQPPLVGLELSDTNPESTHSQSRGGSGGLTAGTSTGNPASNRPQQQQQRDYSAAPSDTIPSLEEQLQAVSADFEISLQQWSEAIGGGADPTAAASNLALTEQFFPDSP
jgi:hypothetical protein